jgi:hypothetical protein
MIGSALSDFERLANSLGLLMITLNSIINNDESPSYCKPDPELHVQDLTDAIGGWYTYQSATTISYHHPNKHTA